MRKQFQINKLESISIAGVGLLGGSLGLALRAAGFKGKLIGIGRRLSSLRRAKMIGAVDEVTRDPAKGVADSQLVILCMPISQFEPILRSIAPALAPGAVVTDVASAKAEVMELARKVLPRHVCFMGSHPMAGSEKSGVEYARADLFDRATCIVTPPPRCPPERVDWICRFWQLFNARTVVMEAKRHDRLLGQISHLPHAVASALVAIGVRDDAIDLAGPGFADTTRIASGDASLWTDIFLANRRATASAIDDLIAELQQFRKLLARGDAKRIHAWLEKCKKDRDQWIAHRYRKKVLPP